MMPKYVSYINDINGENRTMNDGIEIIRLKKKGGKNDN